jgi:hypothetical protein
LAWLCVPAKDFGIAVSRPHLRLQARFRVSSSRQQISSDQEEVSGREEGEELGAVLGETAVAGLRMAELALYPAYQITPEAEGSSDVP